MGKILIVDDDPDVLEVCRLLLERAGHEVTTASSRADGMKALAQGADLMVLDVMMDSPDDGIAMAREIRGAGNKIPILMLTAISNASGLEYRRDSRLVPVDEFFEKPIDSATFIEAVGRLLSSEEVEDDEDR